MRKQKLEMIRQKLDKLFLEHTAKRNWRLTKGMLESIVQILNETDCNPTHYVNPDPEISQVVAVSFNAVAIPYCANVLDPVVPVPAKKSVSVVI